jgi:signal transduction histidine kinase
MLNYRLYIWVLLVFAVIMGGVFLSIAFSYKLQIETEQEIEQARTAVDEAKEMENELIAIKGVTYTYYANKSASWLDSLRHHKSRFTIHLERARLGSSSDAELLLLQQISALFSNFEQNMITAVQHEKSRNIQKSNALILHSAEDLLSTIHQKCTEFININKSSEDLYELEIAKADRFILKILISLGIGGISIGLVLGWLISRMLFAPINQLILTVRSASGEAVLEKLSISPGNDINEIAERIESLVQRINTANRDLSANKELLQHSNKNAALGKIAPNIAHEIRNPLVAIKMLVYSIREDSRIPAETKQDLDIISKEIERLEEFTKDFLRFAKPSEPVFERTSPLVPLNDVIQLLRPRLKSCSISLTESISGSSCLSMADTAQLKQIYLNIILNAIDIMPGGGLIDIKTDIADVEGKSGKYLRMMFADTGPGIPQAIHGNLFEPYIKKSDMGVGIGLSISQSIAKLHSGWITAENRPGGGAVFTVYLPASTN